MPPTRQSTAKQPLSPAVFHILLALADGNAHGYRIRADIIEASHGALVLDPGSLYRLIARLLEDELIEDAPASSRPSTDDARARVYRLTSGGRRLLKAETDRMSALVAVARSKTARRGGHA